MITVPFYRRTQASTLVDQTSYLAFDPAEHACPLQVFQDTSIDLGVIERANEIDQPKLERVVKQIVPRHEENAGYHDEDVNSTIRMADLSTQIISRLLSRLRSSSSFRRALSSVRRS